MFYHQKSSAGCTPDTDVQRSSVSPYKDSDLPHSGAAARGLLDLPIDIIRRIFAKLGTAEELCVLMEVCTKFLDAVRGPEVWRRVKVVDPITRRAGKKNAHRMYRFVTYGLDKREKEPVEGRRDSTDGSRRRKGVGLVVDIITTRAGSQFESLDLVECYPNFPRLDHQMTDCDLEDISIRSSESLGRLSLSPSVLVTGPGLVDLARSCPKLHALYMTGCRCVTDMVLGEIVRVCPTLEDISVSRCKGFRGEDLHARLSPAREILKRLDMSGSDLRSIFMTTFMVNYPALEELDASNCFDVAIDGPAPPPGEICFPSLVKLKLGGAGDRIFVLWEMAKAICGASKNLRVLCLAFKSRGGMLSLEREVLDVTWPPLEHLNLASHNVTDEDFQRLFEMLRGSLVQFDASENPVLTCALQVSGSESFLKLEELNISGTATTNDTLRALLSLTPKLKSVNVSGCSAIDRAIRRNPLKLRESTSTAAGTSVTSSV